MEAAVGMQMAASAWKMTPALGGFSSSVTSHNTRKLTRERLRWTPTQPGLLADLDQADYFKS